MPSLFGPLSSSVLRSASGDLCRLLGSLRCPPLSGAACLVRADPLLCWAQFTELLLSVRLINQSGPRSATAWVPSRRLCKSGLPRPLLGSTSAIFLVTLGPRMPTFSVRPSRFTEFCQPMDRCSPSISGVSLVLRSNGSCSAASTEPPNRSCYWRPKLLRSSSSLNFYCVIHFWSHEYGGIIGPPSRAPMLGKATIPLGGRLVSQKVPIETEQHTVIHPLGTALTP